MPSVSSTAPANVNQWIGFDVHKNSLVASVLPASGGSRSIRCALTWMGSMPSSPLSITSWRRSPRASRGQVAAA